jgi:hypothetical protein
MTVERWQQFVQHLGPVRHSTKPFTQRSRAIEPVTNLSDITRATASGDNAAQSTRNIR